MTDIEAIKTKPINVIVCDYGSNGIAFLQTNPEQARFEDIEKLHKHRTAPFVLKVIELDLSAGTIKDVSDDFFAARPHLQQAQASNPTNEAYLKLIETMDLYFTLYELDDGSACFIHMNPAEETKETLIEKLESEYLDKPLLIAKAKMKSGTLQDISSDVAIDWFKVHRDWHEVELHYLKHKKPEDLPPFILRNHPEGDKLPQQFKKPKP